MIFIYVKFENQNMLSVGFEPTKPKLVDLKSTPLDHSGNLAKLTSSSNLFIKFVIAVRCQKFVVTGMYTHYYTTSITTSGNRINPIR